MPGYKRHFVHKVQEEKPKSQDSSCSLNPERNQRHPPNSLKLGNEFKIKHGQPVSQSIGSVPYTNALTRLLTTKPLCQQSKDHSDMSPLPGHTQFTAHYSSGSEVFY